MSFLGEIDQCNKCYEHFLVSEHILQMPGTKEKEPVICPHCGHTVRSPISNGWWDTRKLSDDEIKQYFDAKK